MIRRLKPRRPLDLGLTLGPLRRGGPSDPSLRIGRSEVWRATNTPRGAAAAHFRMVDGEVVVEAWGDGAQWVLETAPVLLGEEDDLSGFAPRHPLIAELHRRFAGLRLTKTGAVFESLVPTVMEQKVIGAEARAGYRRMVQTLGQPAPGSASLTVPPEAAVLAHTPYWAYHPFSLERRRAETIIRAAHRADRLDALRELPAEVARADLAALPGLGLWSAAKIAMLALGDADAVPVGDYHLPHTVSWALAGVPRGTDEMMLELLAPYHGHRGRVLMLLRAAGVEAPRRGPRLAFRRLERA